MLQFKALVLALVLSGLVRLVPPQIPGKTFGDLVRDVVSLNQGKLADQSGGINRTEAWEAFRTLFAGVVGEGIRTINRDSRLPLIPPG